MNQHFYQRAHPRDVEELPFNRILTQFKGCNISTFSLVLFKKKNIYLISLKQI